MQIAKPAYSDDNLITWVSFARNIDCSEYTGLEQSYHYLADKPLLLTSSDYPGRQKMRSLFSDDLPLSPGDMLELTLTNGEGFAGCYIVNPDGRVQLPKIEAIDAAVLQLSKLAQKIELSLVRYQLFRANTAKVRSSTGRH